MSSSIEKIKRWARPRPDLGAGVYQITSGPLDHRHGYYTLDAWSPDQSMILLLRHDRKDPGAMVSVLDASTGEITPVAASRRWNAHSAARQQWQGTTGRIFFETRDDEGRPTVVTLLPDASERRDLVTPDLITWMCSMDGRHVISTTAEHAVFEADDSFTPRHDKGIVRLDLESGEEELVFSLDDALAIHPEAESVRHLHLYGKQVICHRREPRLLFNFVNTLWDATRREPRFRALYTLGLDGSDPHYLGTLNDHPNWDPLGDRVVANVRDPEGKRRFGVFRGDGQGEVSYVPGVLGGGHPSLSFCGNWVCGDGRSMDGGKSGLIFAHVETGEHFTALSATCHSDNARRGGVIYANFPPDVPIIKTLLEKEGRNPMTNHMHPTWSRDGRTVLINMDETGSSCQLYALDVETAFQCRGKSGD